MGQLCGGYEIHLTQGSFGAKGLSGIDGLPFTSKGYERPKNVLKSKHGKTSEIVKACVDNIMVLPNISGASTVKVHQLYEKLFFNVQAPEN